MWCSNGRVGRRGRSSRPAVGQVPSHDCRAGAAALCGLFGRRKSSDFRAVVPVIPEKLLLVGPVSHGNSGYGSPRELPGTHQFGPDMNGLLAGVLGNANVLSQSRGASNCLQKPIRFGCGGGYSPIRGAHISWAGKRLSSGRPRLGFSPAWLSKNPRPASIQSLFARPVMPYAEKGSPALPDDREATFHSHIKQ